MFEIKLPLRLQKVSIEKYVASFAMFVSLCVLSDTNEALKSVFKSILSIHTHYSIVQTFYLNCVKAKTSKELNVISDICGTIKNRFIQDVLVFNLNIFFVA